MQPQCASPQHPAVNIRRMTLKHRAREVVINDVKYGTFLLLMQYIYCDEVDINTDTAMDLFQVRLPASLSVLFTPYMYGVRC
jgi:hypothetical protein